MAMSVSAGIQKGTTLRVCLPCGERRAFSIYDQLCIVFCVVCRCNFITVWVLYMQEVCG